MARTEDQAWSPQWSPDIEKAWAATLQSQTDARASIRAQKPATIPPADSRTQPLDEAEVSEMRERVQEARPRRRIEIIAQGDVGQLGHTEFELVDELGAGGMGTVYRARQLSLDRDVALKELTDTESMPDAIAHFESEATITAVLEHPSIVPVYDMGSSPTGAVFYSMKLVEGVPWSDLLEMRPAGSIEAPKGDKHDLRAHLEILIEVSQAVAYAHSRGIVHRDIKPQNVMVGEYGEVLLVDWGLACALSPMPNAPRIFGLDQVLVTCGTPAYMPPEIAGGMREWIGPHTDVFMLGAVLFEVLYRIPPHEQKTAIDALKVATKNDWSFPKKIAPALQPFHDVLHPVVTKALSSHPKLRHPNAQEFADAVREAITHLDAAELAADAIAEFTQVEDAHRLAQAARKKSKRPPAEARQRQYRTLGKVYAVLEQALSSWRDNETARHYLVEAQLLHALIALESNELSVVRQQLDALRHLPDTVSPSDEQEERANKLRSRLERRVSARARARRRTIFVWIGAGFLALALVIGATAAALLIRSARDQARLERNHLSRLLIAAAASGVESELEGLLGPVRGSLHAAVDWTRAGRLDSNDTALLTSFFLPLIDGFPVISSVVRADDSGHQYVLLRRDEGWEVRLTTPGEPTVVQSLDARGRVLETRTEQIDYDPRARPWYQAAVAQRLATPAQPKIAWTEAYLFFTAQKPGITASLPVDNAQGRRFVVGVDLLLADLSSFTMRMPDLEHGKVFVLDGNDRVLGLPQHDALLTEDDKAAAILSPLVSVGEPISTGALEAWKTRDRPVDNPFRYRAEGQAWWAGFRKLELGENRAFFIGVALPEANFEAGPFAD